MIQYQNILKDILDNGVMQENRTCYKAKFIPSATLVHDLRDGFPAITTKKLFFKQSIGEILGFLRGYNNAKDFEKLGCKFWFSDANENKSWLNSPFRKGDDDLGKIYGSTWRNREAFVSVETAEQRALYTDKGYSFIGYERSRAVMSKSIDQLHDVIDTIITNPINRRIVMHAWFPELFDQMALPPCHVLYEFVPDKENNVLHMTMFQRSCDALLGVPMNIFGSALILQLISTATGYTAGQFTHNMTNVHLYENQFDAATIQINREPFPLPMMNITKPTDPSITSKSAMTYLETISPSDIEIINYNHHDPLPRVTMAQEK